MKREGVRPTVVTYSALISAAEKGQQWKLALEVLEEMKAAGHGANVIGECYSEWNGTERIAMMAVLTLVCVLFFTFSLFGGNFCLVQGANVAKGLRALPRD
jgi:pentatricopeptide repeat protein